MSEIHISPEEHWSPLHKTLGITVTLGENHKGIASIQVDPEVHYGARWAHGGIVATLADIAGAVSISRRFEDPMGAIDGTIELKINYLRKVVEGKIEAIGTAVHIGRRIGVSDIDVMNNGRLVAKALATYMLGPSARSEPHEEKKGSLAREDE
ncbi:MAG: PaaI family thioesterase [Actinomycetota bacterium]|nr:PaaI family thioesterase [Actinomycetota bacterium]